MAHSVEEEATMAIPKELLDELMKNYKNPEDLMGENGLLKELTKSLVERALEGEMTDHLGYDKHDPAGDNSGNSRNGYSEKTLKTPKGELAIEIPRDRNGKFTPRLVAKNQTHFDGFDDQILSMYSRGMSTKEISEHIKSLYHTDVSAEFISRVTDSVIDGLKDWQNRRLDPVYPILYMDAIRVKIRDEGQIRSKAIYLAIGVTMEGLKEVLGLWVEQTEGAKYWLSIVTELKNRGVNDILIASVDGLKDFPDAIKAVFPDAEIQLCIVHMIRNSVKLVPFKDRKGVIESLKPVYKAPTEQAAREALEEFGGKWNKKYPLIYRSWDANWGNLTHYLGYTAEIRKVIYTTNAIESLNMSLRRVTKVKGSFPNDQAALKLLYMALQNITRRWTMPVRDWGQALNQLAIKFGDRVPV
jgi:putative transposase